jgi:hypothetical protein
MTIFIFITNIPLSSYVPNKNAAIRCRVRFLGP